MALPLAFSLAWLKRPLPGVKRGATREVAGLHSVVT